MYSTVRRAGFSEWAWALVLVVILVAAACGADTESTTSTQPATTTQPVATSTIAPPTSSVPVTTEATSTTTSTTTTTEPSPDFTVASHGAGAVASLPGSEGKLGSGCSPGSGALPDGIWFGWVTEVHDRSLSFDLACLSPGDPPVATNRNPQMRDVTAATDLMVRASDGTTLPASKWDPGNEPVWVYINDGRATEVAHCTSTVKIDEGKATAWEKAEVRLPVGGGCCGEMHNGPPSPTDPWPVSGLPADGVYQVDMVVDSAADDLVLTIMKFVPCDDNPSQCNTDYEEGDVWVDWGNAIARRASLDDNLTMRIRGIEPPPDTTIARGIVGSGTLFGALLDQIDADWDEYVQPEIDAGTPRGDIYAMLLQRGRDDPEFPYGPSLCCGEAGVLAYRGPLGIELHEWLEPGSGYLGSTQLEMVNGRPVLTINAGQIAG